MWNNDELIHALNFAGKAHKGQTYGNNGANYLVHLAAVASEAMSLIAQNKHGGCNENLLVQCAVLHDILEDTHYTYNDLVHDFGTNVADGVTALTKNKALPEDERMPDSVKRIKLQPKEIAMVKLCDRIINLQAPPAGWNDEKIENYRQEALFILESLGYANSFLAERLGQKIEAFGIDG